MSTPETPASVIDVEALIRECVPGGDICDPQQVADAIRSYAERLAQVQQVPQGWRERLADMREASYTLTQYPELAHVIFDGVYEMLADLEAAPASPAPAHTVQMTGEQEKDRGC